ncbi:MAG: mechanosensitive ion channel family protein, partial [bacterium]
MEYDSAVKEYLPIIFEALVLLLICVLAFPLATPFRRRIHTERTKTSALIEVTRNLCGYMARPVLVVVVSQVLLLVLNAIPMTAAWLETNQTHVTAWHMFWVSVLALSLLEGCVFQIFLLRRQMFPVPDLLLDIIRAVLVLAVGLVVIKVELGHDVTPLLASTALLTAVVGFALQGVLGNLLAGMSLHVVGTILPGSWVSIDDLEGKIIQTNWRETRVRTRNGHVITVPNGKIAEALIHDMGRPTPLRRHNIEVGASYSDEPDEVIEALVQAARDVPEVKRHPAPSAFVTAFMDFGINYQLRFWTTQYHRHVPIDGNVNRMIWYQFKRRGIEIPFPMSDKLLNDFMEVIYHQRKLPPDEVDIEIRVQALLESDLCTKLVVDEDGEPLLTREDFEKVAPLVKYQRYTSGETLFRQGDPGETLYLVISGLLQGSIEQADSDLITTFELGAGAMLGEMSLLTGMPRTASITMKQSSVVLEVGDAAFRRMLGLNEKIPALLSDLVAERVSQNKEAFAKLA